MPQEKNFLDILSLCLRSRCPVCAHGRLFVPLLKVRCLRDYCLPPSQCDACGFRFAREAGYYLGVITPTLPILSLTTGVAFTVIAFLCIGPDLPWLLRAGGAGLLFGLVAFMRASVAIFMSFDHAIDPPDSTKSSR